MHDTLNSNNEKLILVLERICERLGSVNKTQAVKLPYLVDTVAARVLGRPITSAAYETWRHGVVCPPLYDLLRPGTEEGGFRVEPRRYVEDEYTVSLARTATGAECLREASGLDDTERAIVDHVADEFGALTAWALGRLTKRMNPSVPPSAWGNSRVNRAADVSENAYERLTPAYQEMAAQLESIGLQELRENSTPVDDPHAWV